jgi:hypothetical protein
MDLRDLVEFALEANGFDGLFNTDSNCACRLGDLIPCGEVSLWCGAGYQAPCDGTCEDGKCDFHIVRVKP